MNFKMATNSYRYTCFSDVQSSSPSNKIPETQRNRRVKFGNCLEIEKIAIFLLGRKAMLCDNGGRQWFDFFPIGFG